MKTESGKIPAILVLHEKIGNILRVIPEYLIILLAPIAIPLYIVLAIIGLNLEAIKKSYLKQGWLQYPVRGFLFTTLYFLTLVMFMTIPGVLIIVVIVLDYFF